MHWKRNRNRILETPREIPGGFDRNCAVPHGMILSGGMNMRPLWKDLVAAMFLGMVLPGILLNTAAMFLEEEPVTPEIRSPPTSGRTARVRFSENEVQEIDLEQYIARVVLAEMPASFEPEALKAQSVAARTYTEKAMQTGGKHGDGSVCTEPSCCQAYTTVEAFLARGGSQEDLDKLLRAVADTEGLVLTYEGGLIEATYFSCSGGATEDAAAVWGVDYPYLKSVESPGEEGASAYTQTLDFTPEEFSETLGRTLVGSPENWITVTVRTEGGGVAEMVICGEAYTGVELRTLLGLRSTAFTVEPSCEMISITTKGYGHRVGMSQYGAEAMAVSGKTFCQILAHYYPGTVMEQWKSVAPA